MGCVDLPPPLCHTAGVRFFNTTGPVRPERHYAVPPLSRLSLDEALGLVRTARYFVLHAPRQTGKTSVLLALQDLLNGGTEASTAACTSTWKPGRRAAKTPRGRCGRSLAHWLGGRGWCSRTDSSTRSGPTCWTTSAPTGHSTSCWCAGAGAVRDAQEQLIVRRETHLDQLADKLRGGARAPRRGAAPERRRAPPLHRPRSRIRARPRAGGSGGADPDRQSDLRGSGPARAHLGGAGGVRARDRLVRGR